MKEHFHQLFEYDHWANNIVFDLVRNNPVANSRVNEMLHHIFQAQRTWVARVNAENYHGNLFAVATEDEIENLKEETYIYWKRTVETRHDPDEVISYTNTKGEAFQTKLKDIITHVINHSEHHRAEIITLLKSEIPGIKIPATDFIFYLRQ